MRVLLFFLATFSSFKFIADESSSVVEIGQTWHLTSRSNKASLSGSKVLYFFWFRDQSGENITFVSPGHGSVVKSRKGEDWFIYHAWLYDKINDRNPGRVLMLDKIKWNSGTIHKFRL